MNKTRILGLSSFILSHLFLILSLAVNDKGDTGFLFDIAWVIGIISVVSNVLLADKIGIKRWLIGLFGVCGTFWFFPYMLAMYFGIPFMIIFLVIGVYIHGKTFFI